MKFLYLLAAVLLSGCAFAPTETITSTNFDYNVAFERSQNSGVLLNVLRASDRKPMYFTAMNALRGNLQSSISTGSIAIPFGPGDLAGKGKRYSAAPTASYTVNPTFDVAVLDTKQFWTGVLTPVPLGTFKYYWEQGWPPDLLLHMFIRSVEKDGKLLDNYPGDPQRMDDFRKALWDIFGCKEAPRTIPSVPGRVACQLQVDADDVEVVGAPLSKAKATDLKNLVEADKAGLKVEPYPGCDGVYRLVPKKRSFHIKGVEEIAAALQLQADIKAGKGRPDCRKLLSDDVGPTPPAENKGTCIAANDKTSKCKKIVYFRSPEAMLYYLGEIARVQLHPDFPGAKPVTVQHCFGTPASPFTVQQSSHEKGSLAAVKYEGATYVIPGDTDTELCKRSMSSTTLTLVLQLLAQLKEASDLPVTGAVNVIGPLPQR
jgi:hypothetical protein